MKEMFDDVFVGGAFKDVYNLLNVSLIGKGSEYSEAANLVQNAYETVMVPVGLALLIIFFVCTLIEKTTTEQATLEQMFLLFAKLVVGVFLIDKGYTILMEFQDAGLSFLRSFHDFSGSMDLHDGFAVDKDGNLKNKDLQALYKTYSGVEYPENPGKFKFLFKLISGPGLTLLLAWLMTFVLRIAVYIIMFMRILEIYIRTMFAPIALADVFYQGLNSTGFRFLKSYLAVSLQMVVIYGCIILNGVIALDLVKDVSSNTAFLFKYIALSAATLGILFRSQGLIKEIIGAN